MSTSQIQRFVSGYINQINDAAIGDQPAPPFGPSPFAGQLGKVIDLDSDNLRANPAVGTVYGGSFQYVQMKANATANPVVGQLVFWDPDVVNNEYVVTTLESGSADNAIFVAGVVLSNVWTPGNYSVIQIDGPTFVKFRGTLTSAGAIGSRVYAAGVGAGVDNGFADVLSSSNPALVSDVSLMQGRYVGSAIQAPTNAGLKLVNVDLKNYR